MTSELNPCQTVTETMSKFPKLSAHIERMAQTGNTGNLIQWDDFLHTLNAAINTRAVPDVPELVRYGYGTNSVNGNKLAIYYDKNGEYVRHDQAAAVIAAKDAEIDRLQYRHTDEINDFVAMGMARDEYKHRAEAAETKLIEWEKADRLVAKALWEDKVKVLEAELAQINELMDEGQGDDEGSQILPDFDVGMTALAKVEACLALLETRRDVIDGYGDKLAQIEKQLELAMSVHRWSVDDAGKGSLYVCQDNHEKGEPCEWKRFIPADTAPVAIDADRIKPTLTAGNSCKTCGGTMSGDGFTTVYHCERLDLIGGGYEPDANPVYCPPLKP